MDGNFTDKIANIIGDLIERFIHLYSLDLILDGGVFAEEGALSLIRGFKRLKNLHILKLNFNQNGIKSSMTNKSRDSIMKAIEGIKTLEILD